MEKYIEIAKELGFGEAAILPVNDLVVVEEYRKYCEENICGNFNKLKACPPESGTVKEMTEKIKRHKTALILQTTVKHNDINDEEEQNVAKRHHNILTEKVMNMMEADGISDILMMGAGPWKNHSCMSAYSVDAQNMSDRVGMTCWGNDGKIRYFSLLLV